MTTLFIVAVRDRAVAGFMPPIFVSHVGMAVRSFSDEVRKPDTQFNAHPDDFDLFELGSFETDTGRFELLPDARQVAIGKSFLPTSS